jgi:hypothetical protein
LDGQTLVSNRYGRTTSAHEAAHSVQALTQQLRLRHYLRGYGYTLGKGIPRATPKPRKSLALEVVVV